MSESGRLLAEVDAYLAFWDLARTDPLDLQLGYDPPAMLEAYPQVDGAQWLQRARQYIG